MLTPALGRSFGDRMRKKTSDLTNDFIENFINEWREKLNIKESQETLFSIVGGKSTDERTASRILAFFFDTTREHNMEDFFIKSFIEAAGENYDDFPHDFTVEKEFYTKHGKIIDILLLDPQSKCNIVIEDKIYADLYNDLKEYYDTAKSKKCGKPEKVKGYVLSLFDVQDSIDEKKVGDNFKCVTYKKFLVALEKNKGDYKISESSKYFVLYKDFIENMSSLEEKIMEELLNTNFWIKYMRVYEKIDEQRISIVKQKIDKIKEALNIKIKKNTHKELFGKIKTWNTDNLSKTSCDDEDAYIASIYFNYTSKEKKCTIQPNIELSLLKGIRIWIDPRKRNVEKNLLTELDGRKGEYEARGTKFYLKTKYDLNEDVEIISDFIISFLENY